MSAIRDRGVKAYIIMMDTADVLRAIASDIDAEYAWIVQRRPNNESVAANTDSGRMQELAWWAAHLRACAESGEYRSPAGVERRREDWARMRDAAPEGWPL